MPRVDGEPALRRHVDTLLPLLIGTVIGFLAAFGTFSGRIAALETREANDAATIGEVKRALADQDAYLRSIAEQVGAHPRTTSSAHAGDVQ